MTTGAEFKAFNMALVRILELLQRQLDSHAKSLDAYAGAMRTLAFELGLELPDDPAPPISPGTVDELNELRKMWGGDREPE
jgi:hypothetical protein